MMFTIIKFTIIKLMVATFLGSSKSGICAVFLLPGIYVVTRYTIGIPNSIAAATVTNAISA